MYGSSRSRRIYLLELLLFSTLFCFVYFISNLPHKLALGDDFLVVLLFPYFPFGLQILASLRFRVRSYFYIPLAVFLAVCISGDIQDPLSIQIVMLLSLVIPLTIDFLVVGLNLRFNTKRMLSLDNLILGLVPAALYSFTYMLLYNVDLKSQAAYTLSDVTGYISLVWAFFVFKRQRLLGSDESKC